jgi:hypothetical protein
MMRPCNSPGSVLAMLIIALLSKGPKVNERQILAKQRMSLAGFCALKQALRTGWLRVRVGSNGCRLVQSDENANSLPIPDCDAGPPTLLFASASDDRLQTSCQALVSGDRMWAGPERPIAKCETNAVQTDGKPNSLKTLLVPRALESRLHSNGRVRKRLLSWLAGYP